MTDALRFRLAALACLAAAVLRAIGAFAAGSFSENALTLLYVVSDLGWLGLASWAGVIGAVLLVRTTTADPAKYFIAAAILSLVLATLAVAGLIARRAPKSPSLLWIASTAVGGVGELAFPGETWPFLAASLIFCAGFAMAGVALLRSPKGES
jgi:hypothetical protein